VFSNRIRNRRLTQSIRHLPYADNGLTETSNTYNTLGQTDSVTTVLTGNGLVGGIPNVANRTTTLTYVATGFGQGQVFTSTDPSGAVTTYTYDIGGTIKSVSEPAGTTSFKYDPRGLRTETTDITGATTLTAFDELGRTKLITAPAVALNGTATTVNPNDARIQPI
jgi:YD repeat-containing protein